MATSERLQMQKLREESENDEQFALVLFEDEGTYSVVEVNQIKESHYAYDQHVNVLWGKGRDAKYFGAKLVLCGSKEECENESMDLSFTDNAVESAESENPSSIIKRKKDEDKQGKGKKKSKGAEKSRTANASWQAAIDEEQRRLNSMIENSPPIKEPLQRSHVPLKLVQGPQERSHSPSFDIAEVKPQHDLSGILSRLDRIESKLDMLVRQGRFKPTSTCTTVSPASSRSGTPILVDVKGSNSGTGGAIVNCSDDDDDDESVDSVWVFNGIDLLAQKAPPKEPTRYATRLAGILFSNDELLQGMIPPLNNKFGRTALDPEKIATMRKCIIKVYSEKVLAKHWGDIRRAVNQKCNDLRKKKTPASTELNSHHSNE